MTQNVAGFAEFQAQKELSQRQHWEKWKKRGFLAYLAMNIAVFFIGAVALVYLIHSLSFKFGWLHSSISISWVDEFLIAVVAGGLIAWAFWSSMKRKFDTLPPRES